MTFVHSEKDTILRESLLKISSLNSIYGLPEDVEKLLSKKVWTDADRQSTLNIAAQCLTDPDACVAVAQIFSSSILDLLNRAKKNVCRINSSQECTVIKWTHYQRFCICLGKILHISPEVRSLAINLIPKLHPFYKNESTDEPAAKKAKKRSNQPTTCDLLHAVYQFVLTMCPELQMAWDWSDLVEHTRSTDPLTKWYAVQSVVMLSGMAAEYKQTLMDSRFEHKQLQDLDIQLDTDVTDLTDRLAIQTATLQRDSSSLPNDNCEKLLPPDANCDVVSCGGILLPTIPLSRKTHTLANQNLVLVPSTTANLRRVALAVMAADAVLLEGPVGCGKTALVQQLAWMTGRRAADQMITVQLGDQTDAKGLLGTYRCTDIAGEFVWQPGVLTKAVQNGDWLMLEDLDLAPLDVLSMFVSLLQTRTLSVPGHGDTIHAHPSFRLFATRRVVSSSFGRFKASSSGHDIVEKLWTMVQVEPLSYKELKEVIRVKFPKLSDIMVRILDIYFLLSAGGHKDENDSEATQEITKHLTYDGRLISTRDLIKWCSRISLNFDKADPSTHIKVFQEAFECFCCSVSKLENRVRLAETIAVYLNITKPKAEFFCNQYKPQIEVKNESFKVGRFVLPKKDAAYAQVNVQRAKFAFTQPAVSLLERIAACVYHKEPVLLVGETGTGKTSAVQHLAHQTGRSLRVINMNQQSDSTDLLGGFKPVDCRVIVSPFREDFEKLFCQTFSRKKNIKFLKHIQTTYSGQKWMEFLNLVKHTTKSAITKCADDKDMLKKWKQMKKRYLRLCIQIKEAASALAFAFIEGTLVKALRKGEWVLLDEINLASAETLECLSGLLESTTGSVCLVERGDTTPVLRSEDFQLFACMNPATDVGKKDLPVGIRNRFTELYVDELEADNDLRTIAASYLVDLAPTHGQLQGIVKFYRHVRAKAQKSLVDGCGHKPHYSLRTLCRALLQSSLNSYGNWPRSLYESFCLSFLSQLDRSSYPVVEKMICKDILDKKNAKTLNYDNPCPTEGKYTRIEGYWVPLGSKKPQSNKHYVLTDSVHRNLKDLSRLAATGHYPVLIQGETSVGKTSLIQYLALKSGNVCLRVNNHEHTDIQEYIGCYVADPQSGKLCFQEGVLVEAMRKGYWIILDELNLAPSDVLEALNRLLDDNRELFIPETQETVKAHPQFMLFATQNPPGQYGGRKVLSRAFRNRFVELHFQEIPNIELEVILHQRCDIPLSYAKKMIAVLTDLQARRKVTEVFAGKRGFITLRDLFRWAERYRLAHEGDGCDYFDWNQQLADNGYMLLAGRVRRPEESAVIQEVLEKHMKRSVDPNNLFTISEEVSPTSKPILEALMNNEGITTNEGSFKHIVWTYHMRRMAVLVGQALKFNEPILLIGETGCGKTTICQMNAALKEKKLYSINCHMHTETSDFLGGLRPVRHSIEEDSNKLFEWVDGPLVNAMREGNYLLVDEISLADDSVLERLNSVLEPERTLLLAEKGAASQEIQVESLTADKDFAVFATMNPGGDYGKKELSPALRNRFTEIWCPLSTEVADMLAIIEHNLIDGIQLCNQEDGSSGIGKAIMQFIGWFTNTDVGKRYMVSIRDILSWVNFINITTKCLVPNDLDGDREVQLDPALTYIHGACLVFLDAIGTGATNSLTMSTPGEVQRSSVQYLVQQIAKLTGVTYTNKQLGIITNDTDQSEEINEEQFTDLDEQRVGIKPFFIPKGPQADTAVQQYALTAPTTCSNAQRVFRALQLSRPILLEGSPGVGKTSLVAAIAKLCGYELIRINLSEQTDVSDLFGADLPTEGGVGGQFTWRDGPLLQALKAGHWVVFDEMNLASQSVLEGLNACLDHRAEIFVPELGRSFQVEHSQTRLFACQNPLMQGGGRKGLPKSFLNRFTQVYIDELRDDDLLFIIQAMYPAMPADILRDIVAFNKAINQRMKDDIHFARRGGPWEFNLRDIFRWCDLMVKYQMENHYDPSEYVNLLYKQRLRTVRDRQLVDEIYTNVFQTSLNEPAIMFNMNASSVHIGHSSLTRQPVTSPVDGAQSLQLLQHNMSHLESFMKCIDMNWMTMLVGSKDSGKSSVVKTLATLTGHKLHVLSMNSSMDTTELLGGFEQTDIKRHIELVVAGSVELCKLLVCELLIHNRTNSKQDNHVQALIQRQHDLYQQAKKEACEVDRQTELSHMKRHLLTVKQLITTAVEKANVIKFQRKDEFSKLLARVDELENLISSGDVTQQGGQFEWIDSVLVVALEQGHWLLIDNVNFCSPSVLDRLNGLLEPGGVLCINERGVIDGQVPTIVPHPEFRLILAMNPQYGEISRAMRNRGVEVFLLSEEEERDYCEQDLKHILHSIGLVGQVYCNVLIKVHQSVRAKSDVIIVNTGIHSLIHAAHLIVLQLRHGTSIYDAYVHAVTDVYVRPQNQISVQKDIKALVMGVLAECEQHLRKPVAESQQLDVCCFPYSTPSVTDWATDPVLSSIKYTTSHLMHALCTLSKNKTIEIQQETLGRLPTLWQLVVENSSIDNWEMMQQWLLAQFATMKLETEDSDVFLSHLSSLIQVVLTKQFNHPIIKKLRKCYKKLPAITQDEWTCHPIDVRYNPAFLRQYRIHYQQIQTQSTQANDTEKDTSNDTAVPTSETEKMEVDEVENEEDHKLMESLKKHTEIVNQLHMVGYLEQLAVIYKSQTALPKMKKSKLKISDLSILQLSFAFWNGDLDINQLPHEVVSHVYSLVFTLLKSFDNMMKSHSSMDDQMLFKFLDGFLWLERFVWTCNSLTSVALRGDMLLSQLSVHYTWLYENLLQYLPVDKLPDLNVIMRNVNEPLLIDSKACKQQQELCTQIHTPLPLQTEKQATLFLELRRCCEQLDIFDHLVFELTPAQLPLLNQRVACLHGYGEQIATLIAEIDKDIRSAAVLSNEVIDVDAIENEAILIEDTEEKLNIKETFLEQLQAIVKTAQTTVSEDGEDGEAVMTESCSERDMLEIQLWPLFSYLSTHALQKCMSDLIRRNELNAEQKESLVILKDYMVGLLPSQHHTQALCQQYTQYALDDLIGSWSDLLIAYHQQSSMSHSIWYMNQAFMLVKRMKADEEHEVFDLENKKEHQCIHNMPWNDVIYTLLLGHPKIRYKGLKPLKNQSHTMHLGVYHQKMKQMEIVREMLWSHANVIAETDFNSRCNDREIMSTALTNLLTAVSHMFDVPTTPDVNIAELDLKEVVKQYGSLDLTSLVPSWKDLLQETLLAASTAGNACPDQDSWQCQYNSGRAWCYLGMLHMNLLAPRGPVDPVYQKIILKQYAEKELKESSTELTVREDYFVSLTGGDFTTCVHPRLTWLTRKQRNLKDDIEDLQKQTAFRPDNIQFHDLMKEVKHFLTNIGSIKKTQDILHNIQKAWNTLLKSYRLNKVHKQLLTEIQAMKANLTVFIKQSNKHYGLYRDLFLPFLSGVSMFQHGLDLISSSFAIFKLGKESVDKREAVNNIFSSLLFPILSDEFSTLDDHVQSFLQPAALTLFSNTPYSSSNITLSIFKAALITLRNHINLHGSMSSDSAEGITSVCTQIVTLWNKLEEEKRIKEEAEESLYKFKSHGDELTETERDEKELKEAFPDYEEDFSDFIIRPLDTKDSKFDAASKSVKSKDMEVLTDTDMIFVSDIHQLLFTTYTTTAWYKCAGAQSVPLTSYNHEETVIQNYQLSSDLASHTSHLFDERFNAKLIPHHLIVCKELQRLAYDKQEKTAMYDFYRDSNVPESLRLHKVIEPLLERINELMIEWPEHPTLKLIVKVIKKIYSIPITAPLMKFTFGLELLIEKVVEWQSIAASHVSLSSHFEALSNLDVEYRKIELETWKSSLNAIEEQEKQKCYKWWLHLHQLIDVYLNEEEPQEQHKSGTEDDDAKPMTIADIISSLKQLMETSSLVEYQPRLQIILAHHCQLTYMESSDRQGDLLYALWNVYCYYHQFQDIMDKAMATNRTPIEKELKAFVKIARWNDINFYALKSAVSKTHATVWKFGKKYRRAITQAASKMLKDLEEPEATHEKKSPENVHRADVSGYLVTVEQEQAWNEDLISDSESVLQRIPGLAKKMRRHCRDAINDMPYEQRAINLNAFIGGIIDSMEELRAAQVPDSLEGDERKSKIHFLHQRKRKALIDLFKYLHDIGLSYRKGLQLFDHADDTDEMMLTPIDIHPMDTHTQYSPSCDSDLQTQWSGCPRYKARCIARRAGLYSIIDTPSKEIGPPIIERCRGYTEQLSTMVTKQHERVAQDYHYYRDIRDSLSSVVHLCQDVDNINIFNGLPDQEETKEWKRKVEEILEQSIYSVQQCQVLLSCCPESSPQFLRPLHEDCYTTLAKTHEDDEYYKLVNQKIQEVLESIGKMKTVMSSIEEDEVVNWQDIDKISSVCKNISDLLDDLTQILEIFTNSEKIANRDMSLSYICTILPSVGEEFSQWHEGQRNRAEPVSEKSKRVDRLETLITSLMVCIQDTVKHTKENKGNEDNVEEQSEDKEEINDEDEDEEENVDLEEDHLTAGMVGGVQKQLKLLKLKKISKHFSSLVSDICGEGSSDEILLLIHCKHVIEQYSLLVQYVLARSVQVYRTTLKMHSILLLVFRELVHKGFCLPADYLEDMEGEGSDKFEDGMGLGEGEGQKDVSDQITSQDQLEDAHREGEDKDKQDPNKQPEVKNEDNAIEMDDDFDAKPQDMEQQDAEDNDNEDSGDDENELEKEMGDLGEDQADKLDDQMWGSDDEDEQQENKDKKEEQGKGDSKKKEELKAKEEGLEKDKQGTEEEDITDKEINEQNEDDSKFNEDEGDEDYKKDPPEMPEDLPDDMEFADKKKADDDDDDIEPDSDDEEEGDEGADQFDIEKMLEDAKQQEEENEDGEAGEEKDPSDDTGEEKEGDNAEGDENEGEEGENDEKENLPNEAEGEENENDEGSEDENAEESKENDQQKKQEEEEGDENMTSSQVEKEDDLEKEQEEEQKKDEETDGARDESAPSQHDTQDAETAQESKDTVNPETAQPDDKDSNDTSGQNENKQEESETATEGKTAAVERSREQKQKIHRESPAETHEQRKRAAERDLKHRLNALQTDEEQKEKKQQTNENERKEQKKSDLYEHMDQDESDAEADAETMDAATDEQAEEKPQADNNEEDPEQSPEDEDENEDMSMHRDEEDEEEDKEKEKLKAQKYSEKDSKQEDKEKKIREKGEKIDVDNEMEVETEGDKVPTLTAQRPPVSTIHTEAMLREFTPGNLSVEQLREQLEEQLQLWQDQHQPSDLAEAKSAWEKYEAITSGLSQELCEQLRLILEPTQAAKFKGDFRTGKRLNMRKVIAYVASQFRKDKIWLRRSKPNKRDYQVMIAVDDSSSMKDNHSKQLAFESLAIISNALTLLEVGQIGISSFGETVNLLHPFDKQFTNQSGASILQQFTFEQKKTKMAQLLDHMTGIMLASRQGRSKAPSTVPTSQLLLIVSDGRGLFSHNMEVVNEAVKRANEAGIFMVFVVIDNPETTDSIHDIKMPIFKPGTNELQEIRSYMEFFPFPFYIVLRDINTLPIILGDALRQWFELVTNMDK